MSFNSDAPWVTPEDHSSVPAVISWFLGTTCVLCVFVKYTTKIAMKRAFSKDDVAVLIAVIFSAGFIASVSTATSNGVGVPQRMLSSAQLQAVEKSVYAASLMYIAVLFFSKAAVLLLLRALTPIPLHRELIWIATGFLVAWSISSLLIIAFQCSVPHTWTFINGSCVNQTAFWTYSGIVNIFTELCVLVIPIVMFTTLQMSLAVKVTIIMTFFLRALLIAPISVELHFRYKLDLSDQSYGLWRIIVCMTITQALSIIFACAPFLKPFFAALETGMVRLDDTRRLSSTTLGSNSGAKTNRSLLPQSRSRGQSRGRSQSNKTSDVSSHNRPFLENFNFDFTPHDIRGWTEIGRGSPPNPAANGIDTYDKAENDVYRHPAQNDSSIVATTTFEVRYTGDPSRSHSHDPSKIVSHR